MLIPDWTESGDTDPQFANTDATQYGFLANSSTPSHDQFSEVFVRDATRKRHGAYGVRVTCYRNSYNVNSSSSLNVRVYPKPFGPTQTLGITDGKEEWFGWSWWFPSDFSGTGSWGTILESFTAENRNNWPTYGCGSWDVQDPNKLRLYIRAGQHPNPGSAGFDPLAPPAGYNAIEVLLGTGAPRPFTKDVWHDFYWYIDWKAQTSGIWDIYHREEGGSFEKLYSNRNDGSALINRSPHQTLYWNSQNGIPPSGGRAIYMGYRGVSSFDLSVDMRYWADGFFNRQTQAAVLAEFPSTELELQALDLAWEEWLLAAPIIRWQRQNPGEWAKIAAYRDGTGPRPTVTTHVGRALVHETDAWLGGS